jgi:hypothetical protein
MIGLLLALNMCIVSSFLSASGSHLSAHGVSALSAFNGMTKLTKLKAQTGISISRRLNNPVGFEREGFGLTIFIPVHIRVKGTVKKILTVSLLNLDYLRISGGVTYWL